MVANVIRQGDVVMRQIPNNSVDFSDVKEETVLSVMGENGHAHTIKGKVKAGGRKKGVSRTYLRTSRKETLSHDEHKPQLVAKGTYEVYVTRDWSPEGARAGGD